METTNIYTLTDPVTNQIRYVGKANDITQRYSAHLNRARKHQTHKKNWIKSLKKKGFKPILEVIDVVPIKDWQFWETYWISQIKTWGYSLVNYTLGGDGCTFSNQTSFKKGSLPWNTGKGNIKKCMICKKEFQSPKSTKKTSCSKKCSKLVRSKATSSTQFEKGKAPWNKGVTGYTTNKKGQKMPDSIKLKISKSKKGQKSKKKRKIKQLDMKRNIIKKFNSITEAVKITGIKGISNVLTGRAKTAGGYLWE